MKTYFRIFVIAVFGLAVSSSPAGAVNRVYFKTSDDETFWCDQSNLDKNLDSENGKLAALCNLFTEPGIHDGKSEATAFELDINGQLFQKYLLDFFKYGEVSFENNAEAENTLRLCEDLGLPLAEKYICQTVLKRPLKIRKLVSPDQKVELNS